MKNLSPANPAPGQSPRPTRSEPSTAPAQGTIGCSGCTTRWSGIGKAHCAACHRTFTTAKLFDRHRTKFECVDPASLVNTVSSNPIMELREDGTWAWWADPNRPNPFEDTP